jgi:hypothetical protein
MLQVIHRGCKDALEESKHLHAEYRNLKVALTETEANVKYMLQHCSNETSFAVCPDSGTEAELERHELMLAAVLRGKARFGRHRRNVQSCLVQQAQAVALLDSAMTAVEGRVGHEQPDAWGTQKAEDDRSSRQTQADDASLHAAHAYPLQERETQASLLAASWSSAAAGGTGSPAWEGSDALLPSRRGAMASAAAARACSEWRQADVGGGTVAATRLTTTILTCRTRCDVADVSGVGDRRDRRAASVRDAPDVSCLAAGSGGWYCKVQERDSRVRFHGDLEEDLWQLVHACDEAERLLMASEGPHDPKRQPLSSCAAGRNGLGASGVPTRPVSSQGAMRACAPRTGSRAPGNKADSVLRSRGLGRSEQSRAQSPDAAETLPRVADTKALRSIENHVLRLCKTVSTVEKQQRSTAAKVVPHF